MHQPLDHSLEFVDICADDYAPTPGSLIGALNRVLQLNVAKLAMDRAEDLRKNFHCWISKNLPEHIPYRYQYKIDIVFFTLSLFGQD